jgi:quercetin 2,3-dioxygenase
MKRTSHPRRKILAALGLGPLAALGLGAASAGEGGRTDTTNTSRREKEKKESPMITLRRSEERGHADHGWLNSYHTFSFAGYFDPAHMGFRSLRVINEDRVKPAQGFGTHPHRDMEIISYVLEGSLAHKDSMGNGSAIRPGDVQLMSAGTGVTHSEFNGSRTEGVHFLQIWITPAKAGIAPGYEQKHFTDEDKRGKLRLIASEDGREGSVTIHQDASVYAAILETGEEVRHTLARGRSGWIHVARGEVKLGEHVLGAGDAAALTGEGEVVLAGQGRGEVLLFDLA